MVDRLVISTWSLPLNSNVLNEQWCKLLKRGHRKKQGRKRGVPTVFTWERVEFRSVSYLSTYPSILSVTAALLHNAVLSRLTKWLWQQTSRCSFLPRIKEKIPRYVDFRYEYEYVRNSIFLGKTIQASDLRDLICSVWKFRKCSKSPNIKKGVSVPHQDFFGTPNLLVLFIVVLACGV